MSDDVKATIRELANALQAVTVLSTELRRALGESADQAVGLEAAADRAVRALQHWRGAEQRRRGSRKTSTTHR
jgi:hypothetical protein